MVINLTKYERKTFISFLSLYIVSISIFVFVIAALFYEMTLTYKYNELTSQMKLEAKQLSSKIIIQHMDKVKPQNADYSTSGKFQVTLLDQYGFTMDHKKKLNLNLHNELTIIDNMVYLIENSTYGHLGVYYIVIAYNKTNEEYILLKNIIIIFGILYLVMIVFGYFLAKLFLKPIVIQRDKLNTFIKDSTHELNTPVSALMMCVDSKNVDCEKNFSRIKLSAQRISEIYKDLTYLFLDEHDNDKVVEELNLKSVLDNQMDYFITFASKKRITLNYHSSDIYKKIDEESFIRLSNNLISNAIKYTSAKGIIDIQLENGQLIVKDTGIGIKQEKQKEIFDRFYRATSNAGGFGIGLNIVKRICDTYKIKIDLESMENKGTTFTITF